MKKENIFAGVYAGMSDEEREFFNKVVTVNEDSKLSEVKEKIRKTGEQDDMTVRELRCSGMIVAARNAYQCRMEIYDNGLAVYQNASRELVLRMEDVGRVKYEGDPCVGIEDKTYSLDDYSWGIALMLRGEERLEEKRSVCLRRDEKCPE
ncbi:MAG: hypothetical protein LIO86_15155 [Lachnospiraceae bacterium]|nr:hypothetical protein [Lachnospiraceae bacterium]